MHNKWRHEHRDEFSLSREIFYALVFSWMAWRSAILGAPVVTISGIAVVVYCLMRVLLWYAPDAYVERRREESVDELRDRLTDMIPAQMWGEIRRVNRSGRLYANLTIHVQEFRK